MTMTAEEIYKTSYIDRVTECYNPKAFKIDCMNKNKNTVFVSIDVDSLKAIDQ